MNKEDKINISKIIYLLPSIIFNIVETIIILAIRNGTEYINL